VAFAEMNRCRYAELAYLLGAIGYTASVCFYWHALNEASLSGGPTRQAIENVICRSIGGETAIGPIVHKVHWWYGGYAVASALVGGRSLWVARARTGWARRKPRLPWGLIAYAELFGILIYVTYVENIPCRQFISNTAAIFLLILALYWSAHYRGVIAKAMVALFFVAVGVARAVRKRVLLGCHEIGRGLRIAARVAMRGRDASAQSARRAVLATRTCLRKQRLRIRRFLRRRRPLPVSPRGPPA